MGLSETFWSNSWRLLEQIRTDKPLKKSCLVELHRHSWEDRRMGFFKFSKDSDRLDGGGTWDSRGIMCVTDAPSDFKDSFIWFMGRTRINFIGDSYWLGGGFWPWGRQWWVAWWRPYLAAGHSNLATRAANRPSRWRSPIPCCDDIALLLGISPSFSPNF